MATVTPLTEGMRGERSSYEASIRYWCEAAYEEAKKEVSESPEIKDIERLMGYLNGEQWRGSMPAHRARPVTNKTLRLFWETVGLLTDIQPIFNVKASDSGDKYSGTQKILNLITKAWALENNFDQTLAMIVMWSMLTTGYCKIEWDQDLAHGAGDIRMIPSGPESVLVLGADDDDLQSSECVIYRKVRTLAWIKRKYPVSGSKVKPDAGIGKGDDSLQAPAHVTPQLFKTLGAPMKRLIGVRKSSNDDSVFPRAEVREFWIKDSTKNQSNKVILMGPKDTNWCYEVEPGAPLYPRGRVIVMANGVLLDDQPNPYWHGLFPFCILRLQHLPWKWLGASPMKPIVSMNDITNQIDAGVLNMIKQAISPQLMAPRNAFSDDAWKNIDASRPNEKLKYSANAPFKPEYKQPPSLPAYVLQMETSINREMDMFSGASAVAQAAGKKQVPSGDSLEQITNSRNTPIRMMGRGIETFIRDAGRLFVPCCLQFYTAERRIDLMGTQGLLPVDYDTRPGSLVPDTVKPETYARKFKFNIEQGTLLNVQKTERINMGLKLRAMQALSLKQLFKILDFNIDVKENEAELIEEAKLRASFAPPPGGKGKK
jgi:hypothetical protein